MTLPADRSRRDVILGSIGDTVGNWIYYDRKEDEDLPRDAIQEAVEEGEITVEEILDTFREKLLVEFEGYV